MYWKPALAAAALLGSTLIAASGFDACEAPPSLAVEIDRAAARANSPVLPFEQRMANFQRLLDQQPTDLFVNRRFLAQFRGYAKVPLFDRLVLPRYEKLYSERPSDPIRAYLYAISVARRDPTKSSAILEKLARDVPDAPWPYLAGAKPGVEKFMRLCPETLDPEAVERVSSTGSPELKRETEQRLRRQIGGRSDALALSAWIALWQIEFQLTPDAEHTELRGRIRNDLASLRQMTTRADETRLAVLRQGYQLALDPEGSRWAQEELLAKHVESRAAADSTIDQWYVDNPRPPRNASVEEQDAYTVKLLEAAPEWVRRWPDSESACQALFTVLMAPLDLPAERVVSIGNQALACSERNPDFTFGFTDQPLLSIADRFVRAGVENSTLPVLIERALDQASRRRESDLAAARSPQSGLRIRGNYQIERWEARRIMVAFHARARQSERAAGELETLRQEVAAFDVADPLTLWRGLQLTVEAAIDAKREETAREVLVRMRSVLAAETPTTPQDRIQHALRESVYWKSRALLAISDRQKADAVSYFLRAAKATPDDYDPASRARLNGRATELWKTLGGSSEGLEALGGSGGQPTDASRWMALDKRMPPFPGQDFTGKTLFINVWATWCGPCQAELPFVQRLYEALKDRTDGRVLTFNIDENPGLVQPFMQQHGFTFPVVLARDYVEQEMKVEGIPRNWIVDSKGILRMERSAGASETFVSDVQAAIRRVTGR